MLTYFFKSFNTDKRMMNPLRNKRLDNKQQVKRKNFLFDTGEIINLKIIT